MSASEKTEAEKARLERAVEVYEATLVRRGQPIRWQENASQYEKYYEAAVPAMQAAIIEWFRV